VPPSDFIVSAEIPSSSGKGGTKVTACEECDDVAE
jgi:hypothetical protein